MGSKMNRRSLNHFRLSPNGFVQVLKLILEEQSLMSRTIYLISVTCILAFAALAQTNGKAHFFCSYGEGNHGAELCERFQKKSFASNQHAERAVNKILKPTGLESNFILVSCPDISNAAAFTFLGPDGDGIRYIFYDNDFMEGIDRDSNTNWGSVSVLAHEIAHHLLGHSTLKQNIPPTRAELEQRRGMELEADKWSGFAMFKLRATLEQAQAAMNALDDVPDPEDNYDHPKKWRRLQAIKTGYNNARSQESGNDTNKRQTTFPSEVLEFTVIDTLDRLQFSEDVQIFIEGQFAAELIVDRQHRVASAKIRVRGEGTYRYTLLGTDIRLDLMGRLDKSRPGRSDGTIVVSEGSTFDLVLEADGVKLVPRLFNFNKLFNK